MITTVHVCPVCGDEHKIIDRRLYVCQRVEVEIVGDTTNTRWPGNWNWHYKWDRCPRPNVTHEEEPIVNTVIHVCPVCGGRHVLAGKPQEYTCGTHLITIDKGQLGVPTAARLHTRWLDLPCAFQNVGETAQNPRLDLSPEAPTEVNSDGGRQSYLGARADLIPAKALLHVAGILDAGAKKYGEENWRKIPTRDHVNHALVHLFAHLSGDTQDDHLGHACCRLQMALETHLS